MNKKIIIQKTKKFIRKKLDGEGSGHDWWHTYRVWKNALNIAKKEKADLFKVQLAALLHDIADWKFHKGNHKVGPKLAKEWLINIGVDTATANKIYYIIQDMPFKGAMVKSKLKTKEGQIVQDADRLDAIGAIGIARCFAYGGHANREIYNPNIKPIKHRSFKEYKNNKSASINHFYEKLLLLKNLMNTKTAKNIAAEKHNFMKQFLKRFFIEWEGR